MATQGKTPQNLNPGKIVNATEPVQQIKSDQKGFYAEILRQKHPKVFGRCLSLLRNRTEAAEASQDIFVKAYQSLEKFRGDSSFSTWLYRIATNHCLDVLRKRNHRKTCSLEAMVEEKGERIFRFYSSPSLVAQQLEHREIARKILSTLPVDYRTILTLREADGLHYREIAEVLECPLETVRSRLCRARRQLQEVLRHFLDQNDIAAREFFAFEGI